MAEAKIVITGNYKPLKALLSGLANKKQVQRAVARSIKRTIPSVQKSAFQQIRAGKMLRLSSAETKKRVRTYYNKGGASDALAKQYGKLYFTSFGEGLVRYYAKRVRAGRSSQFYVQDKYGGWKGVQLYSVRVNQYGAQSIKDPKRTFMAKVKGRDHVFQRLTSGRLPIEKLKGPGISELIQTTKMIGPLTQLARTRYLKEFDNNLKFYVQNAINRAKSVK